MSDVMWFEVSEPEQLRMLLNMVRWDGVSCHLELGGRLTLTLLFDEGTLEFEVKKTYSKTILLITGNVDEIVEWWEWQSQWT